MTDESSSANADEDEDVRAAIAGELRLLEPSVRRTPAAVEAMLHADFFEFGASGRRWSRPPGPAGIFRQFRGSGQRKL